MDHKAFLSSLSGAERAALSALDDGPGLRRLAAHASLIAGLAALIVLGVPGWPVLMLPLGILLAFLFNLEHECTHKTPFRTPWINEWAGRVSGFVIIQPFLWFRYFHLAHHRFTNDPERDPELVGKPKPRTWIEYVVFVSAVLYWRGKIQLLFANAFGNIDGDFIPKGAHDRLRREARIMIALYGLAIAASILLATPVLLWIWIVPLAIGFPFLRLYHLAEHGLCPTVADMFVNTRTVFTNSLVRFVTWNMPYHIEHHVMPTVPFYRLPEFHQRVQAHLKQTSDGYVAFTREYAGHLGSPGEEPERP